MSPQPQSGQRKPGQGKRRRWCEATMRMVAAGAGHEGAVATERRCPEEQRGAALFLRRRFWFLVRPVLLSHRQQQEEDQRQVGEEDGIVHQAVGK